MPAFVPANGQNRFLLSEKRSFVALGGSPNPA
jgi:hypothetical protein